MQKEGEGIRALKLVNFAPRVAICIIAIICLHILASVDVYGQALSNVSPQAGVTVSLASTKFLVTIEQIVPDPLEGWWIVGRTGATIVLIWEDDVRNLSIGIKYRIMCTRIGVHPGGEVNIYVAIVWDAVDLYDESE